MNSDQDFQGGMAVRAYYRILGLYPEDDVFANSWEQYVKKSSYKTFQPISITDATQSKIDLFLQGKVVVFFIFSFSFTTPL